MYIRIVLMAVWSIFCILLSAIVAILTLSPKIAVGMARWLWSPLIILISGAKVSLTQHNTNYPQPAIVVANHESFLDIPLLFRHIPFNIHFVAKKEIKKMPFIGWYMWLTGMIFIDRSNRIRAYKSLEKAGKLIKKGKSTFTFPEGSRSIDGQIHTYKQGVFHLALEAKVPIIPVKITGAGNVWPANSLKMTPNKVNIHIGEAILPETYAILDAKQLAQLVEEKTKQLRG